MQTVPSFLSARAMRWLDIGVVLWTAFWLGIATYTGYEVNALRTLSDTVVASGTAAKTAGQELQVIGSVPLVGGRLGALGRQAVAAGESAEVSGRSSHATIDQLAILLGLAIGLIPTVPLLMLYLPLRRSTMRDKASVSDAVRQWRREPALEAFLARRALAYLPYQELRSITADPAPKLDDGGCEDLASAELRRLGLDPAALGISRGSRPES